ncbi:hypothetical protein ACQUQU_07285 [Thalassolituus sp. LLYu03]|uniref:hypothetical protein n=1 Tax=Thalassolituus sp. LLYu03 TaxID=3421656 RepID=UPI003D26C7FB
MKQFIALLCVLISSVTAADNVVRLEGISIQGNSEEPNVLYITPWQPPPGTGRLYQPVSSYRQQWLSETDRQSFNRELRYAERYAPLKPDAEKLRQLTDANR